MKGGKSEMHGLSRHPLYFVWKNMLRRCSVPTANRYESYGGRGISVCKEWFSVVNFVKWATTHGWKEGLQINRIDNDGNYSPANCNFVTPKHNTRNRRSSKLDAEKVSEIKNMLRNGAKRTHIAELFAISCVTVHNLEYGERWSDIP